MDSWRERLGIPEKVIELYGVMGNEQRGAPEIAMGKFQQYVGGGVLSHATEHVGDLSNRVSPMHGFGWGREAALGKAKNQLGNLTYAYGFEREHNENLVSSAEYFEIPLEKFKAEVDRLLKDYVDAHKKLKAYNQPQYLAREAAIMLGSTRFALCIKYLERFINIVEDEERYTEAMKAYYKTSR
jgi:hypothetical protein